MSGMVDGVNKIWTIKTSPGGGMDFQGFASETDLAKEMIRRAITDWSADSGLDEKMVTEFKRHINKVVKDIESLQHEDK